MAQELTQEEVLDFLCQAGGKVPNAVLLRHFGRFLRDPGVAPEKRLQHREQFKRFVNSVAVVRPEHGAGATPSATITYVVLRSRYRDLLGEELQPPGKSEENPPLPAPASGSSRQGAPSPDATSQTDHWHRHEILWPPAGGRGGGREGAAAKSHSVHTEAPRRRGAYSQDWEALSGGGGSITSAYSAASGSQGVPCLPSPALLLPLESQLHQTAQWLSSCLPPEDHKGAADAWTRNVPVFKSIRCQLAWQDLEDFVEQGSCESEGSDSGDEKEEGGSSEAGIRHQGRPVLGLGVRKFASEAGQTRASKPVCLEPRQPKDHHQRQEKGIGNPAPVSGTASSQASQVNGTDQEAEAIPRAHKFHRHRKVSSLQEKASSSEDDWYDKAHRKKSKRHSSCSKKGSQVPMLALAPAINASIAFKPVGNRRSKADCDFSNERQAPSLPLGKEPMQSNARAPSLHQGSSSVPLDPKEHDWIVKLASGSWTQAYALFLEDPQLAVRKDFISGYTVLHWVAKHGDNRMFQELVTGARKAGVALDVDVKSSCGYTPLHIAAIHGHQKVMKLLVQKLKVKVNVRDNSGKKAWQYLSSSSTSGDVWQLLGAPRGKTIFPVRDLTRSISPTRKGKSQLGPSHLNRKTSLAALLKPQHLKWKIASQLNNLPLLREREVYSD
ncbi:ankyrin repeat domain-containing protein SOWAHB [Rhinatrema bivittatum]|uniref:ankyrin repeat domain-containing protein SOWAHB n=1 Tax=Rhinatrema bivittatum TaxID=194408 RepID=UPI00112CC2FF|nr:ankyrin repeat domain-containing protein SOWAHB [Rhinatrema bivittatum]